jgi:hypothetical protein
MPTRDELKAMVDVLPQSSLERVHTMMKYQIEPPPPPSAEVARMRQRGQEYRKAVEQSFRENRRPGTIAGMAGGGSWGTREGTPFGRSSFHYWDGKALVQQTLQSFDSYEVELMERFSMSEDGTKLVCSVELSSGGRTVRHDEEFPVQK